MSSSTWTNEALLFRWFVGNHVADATRRMGVYLQMDVITEVPPADESVLNVQAAFNRAMRSFIAANDHILEALLRERPETQADIEQCVVENSAGVGGFKFGSATWARVEVVAAFLVKLSLWWLHNVTSESTGYMLDKAATIFDDTLSDEVRANGGWLAFAQAYSPPAAAEEKVDWMVHLDDVMLEQINDMKL
jgi:hypothetical protein